MSGSQIDKMGKEQEDFQILVEFDGEYVVQAVNDLETISNR